MDLKLGHYSKDGIEVVEGERKARLRELLIDLASKNSYQLVVNLQKVGFPGSAGLGVLVGGLKRVRAHDGSLDLVCTQERILKIFKITRADEGLRHLPDRGPGHSGQEVSNSRRVRASRRAGKDLPAHPRSQLTSTNTTEDRYTPTVQAAARSRTSKPCFMDYRATSAAEPRPARVLEITGTRRINFCVTCVS